MSILPQPHRLARLNAYIPGCCVLCEGRLHQGMLCDGCIAEFAPLPELHCPQCALPLQTPASICSTCQKTPPAFDLTYSAFLYAYPLKHLIHAYKYLHHHALSHWLASQLKAALPTNYCPDLILPVPLHPERQRDRGFNQAHEIAKPLARQLGCSLDSQSLSRRQATAPQANASHIERRQHMRGAFWCDTDFTGKTLLLIDDVLTTGSTANECARTLKLHGASAVHIGVCARTPMKINPDTDMVAPEKKPESL